MKTKSNEVTELLALSTTGHSNWASVTASSVASGIERLSAILEADMKAAIEKPHVKVVDKIRATK